MKKRFQFLGLLVIVVLGLSALPWALAQEDDVNAPAVVAGSDEDPNAPFEMIVPEEFRTPAGGASVAASTTTLYFTPQDNDINTTVMFFYNTGDAPATVMATTYAEDGTVLYNFSVTVPVRHFVRVCGDVILNAPPSWVNAVLWNFRDFSVYAKMVVPAGIKVDAYVVWDGLNGYDPSVAVDTAPIRFSTDPLTVFMPNILRDYP